MSKKKYYLEKTSQAWSGIRQLHSDDCGLLPAENELKLLGSFNQAVAAMTEARKIHRKAISCYTCCKAQRTMS